MTESAIFSILTKLAEPIFKEAVMLHGVSDDVDWLASEMRWMQSFLKDAETKRRSDRSNLINNWVRDVREVAQEAEDIIDTFMLTIERQRQKRRIGGLRGRVKRYAYLPWELKARHKVGVGIQKLRTKVQQIKASKENYGLVDLGQTSAPRPINDDLHERRRIAPHLHNDNTTLIGFDAHKKAIIGQLLDADIKQRCVVSIVGAGGIGKTTLATKIYNNSQIKSGFSVHACVSVSQTFQYDDMVRRIAKDILGVSRDQLQSMEMKDVELEVYEFLNDKRYLIILDDVWRVNVWDLMSKVLPDAKNGSRVLVTTRSMEIATSAFTCIKPYEMPLLDNKQSWDLFLHFNETITTADSFMCFSNLDQLVWMELCGGIPEARHLVFPPNLTTLKLRYSKLEQDQISVLEKLPNLTTLRLLHKTFRGTVMICTTGGFPSLQQLFVHVLQGLEDWRVECGAMPKLNFLNIYNCQTLAMLPEGLQHLTFLKRLEVYDLREEFKQRLEPEVGEDWYKIRHVPNIFIDKWKPHYS